MQYIHPSPFAETSHHFPHLLKPPLGAKPSWSQSCLTAGRVLTELGCTLTEVNCTLTELGRTLLS
jgi:hypothetical protein